MNLEYKKINSIKSVGEKDIYHLTVKKNKSFFGNKICLHNCDYRGELSVILMNLGNESFTVKNGDRIAQGVLANVTGERFVSLTKVSEIDTNTDRSTDGFGSTGIK